MPVPTIFSGDPMEFVNFERSFMTLIESRGLEPTEKLFYLKQYISGAAKEAVEGCFFGSTDTAYKDAWDTLRERFGHPFKIQQVYRSKLENWPKIHSTDATSLQRFADFLKSCSDARQFFNGLQILDNCLENQKMLKKLPEYMIVWWNRIGTEQLEEAETFPTFREFAQFDVVSNKH